MLIGAVAPVRQTIEAPAPAVDARRTDSGFQATTPAPERSGVYYSPKLRFDNDANVVVIEFRDLNTGKLERSIPTKGQLEAYEKAAKIARAEEAEERRRATQPGDGQEQATGGTGLGTSGTSATGESQAARRVDSPVPSTAAPLPQPAAAAVPASVQAGGGPTGLSAASGYLRQIDV